MNFVKNPQGKEREVVQIDFVLIVNVCLRFTVLHNTFHTNPKVDKILRPELKSYSLLHLGKLPSNLLHFVIFILPYELLRALLERVSVSLFSICTWYNNKKR